ncbi:hypothetical protein BV509_00240 [Rhodovulum sulfidophilum]|uniref:Uncharacterized protein n=1 Tax=Rhodovulum visakhapatnamense TaxID=364297 RepID=A0ABS1RF09_9RHOB|nr:hypothetical protein [Rhodovulum visakhapatnamense]MBL3569532.1 hypothetical protein [Rhodovulum visakhapatnamense]MBL3578242.1 hypothetical protein [Rhodovulum visakhapatnamense]OLS42934.1 hypothetical protein BV509_00240 [Rhodovulum sulfidophilum]
MRSRAGLISVIFLQALPASADDHEDDLGALIAFVRTNPLTDGGGWLERQNVFGHWKKLALIFGVADPGDFAACAEIASRAAETNPARRYRCTPED